MGEEKKKADNFWYSANKVLSYGCLFSMVVGERGNGKTYDFKCRGIKRWLKGQGQFYYLRRSDTELKESMATYFDNIAEKFPAYEFRCWKNRFQIRPALEDTEEKNDANWETMGYGGALSTAMKLKSTSYSQVSMICFDEFLIPGYGVNRYLPDEVNLFLNFYETIARMRDVFVIFCSNAMSLINPYFLAFGVVFRKPPKGFVRIGEEIVIEFTDCEEYKKAKKATRFGKLVAGTEFEKNSIDNEFSVEDWDDLRKIEPGAYYMMSITYEDEHLGIYLSKDQYRVYVSKKYDRDFPVKYEFKDSKQFRKLYNTRTREIRLLFLIEAMKCGNLFFEESTSKTIFYNFLKNIL